MLWAEPASTAIIKNPMKTKVVSLLLVGVSLALTVHADLTHRYSFNETPGSTIAADSVAGTGWDATLNGAAILDGTQLVLDGTFGTFAQLPAGMITNTTAVTVESWVTFGTQVADWARLFDFGAMDDQGGVLSDFRLEPRAPGNYVDCYFGTPSGAYVNHPQGLDNQTNVHVVVVLNPSAGVLKVYTNGTLISSPPSGPLPALSGLTNQISYIGKSFYNADPYLTASVDEFRVWNQALSTPEIEASFEAGPNNMSTGAGALQKIELSLALPSLSIGLSEGTTVNGYFANLTNAVNLNGTAGITYQSGDTNIITVSTAGLIQSVSNGITTIIANYQGLSATQSVTVVPNSIMPSHRYSFNSAAGSTVAVDSIGGAAWNGTLQGNAVLDGHQLVLDGSDGTYVNLPAGIIGNGKAVTVEAWATFGVQSRDWSRLFSFGNLDAASNVAEQLRLSPRAGGNWVDFNYLGAYANHPQGWDNQTNLHIVAVANPPSGFLGIYANGVLIGRASNATTPLSPAPDQLSYLGRSLYPADPYLVANINEFRIYEGALSPDRIAVDTAAGPDNLITNAGALQSASLVLNSEMKLAETQHASFAGNFTAVSNVDLFLYGVPAVSSSDTNVVTIDATGLLTAVKPGTATVTANFGGFQSSKSVTVVPAALTHRYSFNDAPTSTAAADSIGGSAWNGALNGDATLSGSELVLDGVNAFVQLPAGIINGYSSLSIETWASLGANGRWVRLWDFGDQNSGGGGNSSIYFSPHNGGDGLQLTMFNPGTGSDVALSTNLDNVSNLQIVGVYTAGSMSLYFNGALVGQNLAVTLPVTANVDMNSFIGKSMFNPDPYLTGSVDEFRIYQGALTPAEVASHYAAGPNALPAPAPSLSIRLGQGAVTISWSTNGTAGYALTATGNLSGGWSSTGLNPTIQNGQNVVSDPIGAAPKFYRLQRGP